jgi:hypothetical protein
MVTEYSTQPTYEPYVGGMSAPNLQYPFYPTFTTPTLLSCGVNLWNNMALEPIYSGGVGITEVARDYTVITTNDNYTANGYISTGKTLKEICPGLEAGKTYTLWGHTDSVAQGSIYVQGISTWKYGVRRTLTDADLSSRVVMYGLSASAGEGTGECRISNIMITESAVQPKYTPYFDGGTVQCPELYATTGNEYSDTYDTQTGKITRKILKALLTGNETITASTGFGNGVRIANIFDGTSADGYIGLCSHAIVGKDMHFTPLTGSVFWHNILGELNMTLEEFKVWLAEQYNSGKPVTLWYVLDTPTQEFYPFERLKIPKGSGQIFQKDSGLAADIEAKVLKHS